jgi:hypothetical protein
LVAQTKVPPSNGKTDVKIHAPKRLDVGCGKNKQQGFKGIDIAPDSQADIIHDLWEVPWPIKANCVEEAFSSHLVEHIPHHRPGWTQDGFFRFFDELYRVMKKDGTVQIHHPYVKNDRAFWDPTHVRYIHEVTWYYLSAEWRKMQGLDHYDVSCDFEVVTINTDLQGDLGSRSQEVQGFARNHYWNAVGDLMVLLKALK